MSPLISLEQLNSTRLKTIETEETPKGGTQKFGFPLETKGRLEGRRERERKGEILRANYLAGTDVCCRAFQGIDNS